MDDRSTDTMVSAPRKLVSSGDNDACLVLIYPTGHGIGRQFPLSQEPVTVGRGDDNDIRIQDNSVSRRHARILPGPMGHHVVDLGSTNGTFVDDQPTDGPTPLPDGCYLRVGNCIFKFLTGGNIEADYHEEIYRLTIIDGLTDIHNHRYLMDFLDRELARSIRHGRPLSVLLFDIDHFKRVNDQHGHLCGDFVLRELSHRIKATVRREDLFARYGGEEFALVLVETDAKQAADAAERVRAAVANQPFRFEADAHPLTVSVGVAGTSGGEQGLTAASLVDRADQNLYKAKNGGRNRVVA